ncbi:MAG: protein-L-isoaspartate O-methyltransferase family protein [Sulfurifustaceae bacterium]
MQAIDFETARRKMLDQQIRPWDVTDERVLGVIACTRREEYVPEEYRALAYIDMSIPLGFGQVMLAPKLEARLLQTLGARSKDKVLEIGVGSGHVAALLSGLSSHVDAVEIIPPLAERATEKLTAHGIRNITVEVGDASRGWEKHAPYDRILVTGSVPILPAGLREQLAPGGRLVVVVGRAPAMEVLRIDRVNAESWKTTSLFETVIPSLTNAPEPPRFVF